MTTIENSAHFELIGFKDLYSKAEYEFSKIDKLMNSYDLFNFLCTINHLYDWAKNDPSLSGKSIPDNQKGVLDVVRQLCNRAKHFEKRNTHPDTTVKKGYGMGRYGVGVYGVGEPSYTVSIDGKDVQALEICKSALDEWEKFIKDLQ